MREQHKRLLLEQKFQCPTCDITVGYADAKRHFPRCADTEHLRRVMHCQRTHYEACASDQKQEIDDLKDAVKLLESHLNAALADVQTEKQHNEQLRGENQRLLAGRLEPRVVNGPLQQPPMRPQRRTFDQFQATCPADHQGHEDERPLQQRRLFAISGELPIMARNVQFDDRIGSAEDRVDNHD